MKTSLSSVLCGVLLVMACDLEPGSIGDESDGSETQKTDDPTGDPTGGGDCSMCGASEVCVLPTGVCEATPDIPGNCDPIPDTCPTILAPVCGCNDVTYSNQCDARVSGVNVLHDGECGGGTTGGTSGGDPSTSGGDPTGDRSTGGDNDDTGDPTGSDTGSGDDCDGFAGLMCPDGEYCHHEPGICVTTADALGQCRLLADACIEIEDPVCGCDGVTYSNSCYAELEGVSVAHAGACGIDGEALCQATGGSWDVTSCGHYQCGMPPACAAVVPGCDCGDESTFYEAAGCMFDPACP